MPSENILYVGTTGQGVWRSLDHGETFQRRCAGMFMEAEVRALCVSPHDNDILFAGTDAGIYRSMNGGERWVRIDGPFDPGHGWPAGIAIWSLLIHPADPNLVFAGACPSAIYRSRDGGDTWHKLDVGLAPECPPLVFSRVTCLRSDPSSADRIWAGVEIDALWRSDDQGDTWLRLSEGLSSQDIHDIALMPQGDGNVLVATNNDLNLSTDRGSTWQPQHVRERFPFPYCRALTPKADDPATLFLGNGNGPPGTAGALQISRDGGASWEQAELPVPPNSTIWSVATHPGDPDRVYCSTINGYVYRSEDAGRSWRKCAHEFGEIRTLALVVA